MKRFIILVLIFCAIVLSSCTQSPYGYPLLKHNGQYYILLDDVPKYNGISISQVESFVFFDSVTEMISDIRSGNFTEAEINQIKQFSQKDALGRIPVFDLDAELYQITIPDDLTSTFKQKVKWYGSGYRFEYSADSVPMIIYGGGPCSKFEHESRVNNFYGITKSDQIEILEEMSDSSGATTYIYIGPLDDAPKKRIIYSIKTENGEAYIMENFKNAEELLPYSIEIQRCEDGHYYSVLIMDTDRNWSVDQLLEFRLERYTPDK